MIASRIQKAKERRGAIVVVEFAVVVSFILMPLLLGIWELGRILELQQVLANAAREGGRIAAAGQSTSTQVAQVVANYINQNNPNIVINPAKLTITIQDLTSPGTDPSQANQLDQIQVAASIPFSDVRWDVTVFKPLISPSTIVTGTGVWYSLRDQTYPAPPTPSYQ